MMTTHESMMSAINHGHPNWASIACAANMGYERFFESQADVDVAGKMIVIDIDAIQPKDRPAVVGTVLTAASLDAAIRAEMKRHKVRFLPAQVIRRIRLSMGLPPGYPRLPAQ